LHVFETLDPIILYNRNSNTNQIILKI
jgi:hypothetical protein